MPGQSPGSVGQYFCDGLLVSEVHTSACAHCQRLTDIPSRRRMTDHVDVCRGCMRLICLWCVGQPCRPWEKECERLEREARLRNRYEFRRDIENL
jgi:hypothetical protein